MEIMKLFRQNCTKLNSNSSPLKPEEIDSYLSEVNSWSLVSKKYIEKNFVFKNFKESLHFILRVSDIAEDENHHPDISFGWGYAKITLFSHDLNGLHKNDFIIASKIDKLIEKN